MKIPKAFLLLLFPIQVLAQDPFTTPLVVQTPEMQKVTIQKGLVYKTLNKDTSLTFDAYYPPGFDGKRNLPLVIFNNGVGAMEIPLWLIYKDWARLVAVHGMIAINYQSRPGKALADSNDLLNHIRKQSDALHINKDNLGIWTCSANAQVGWPLANNPQNAFINAIVIYYGFIQPADRVVNRRDLEILVVTAGLDSYGLNRGLEELMSKAVQADSHLEFINYPEGQHAFDAADKTQRSREIVLQTIDFLKRNLIEDNTDAKSTMITNRQLWQLALEQKQIDEAIVQYRKAHEFYSHQPNHTQFFNQFLNENNLNYMGYQLYASNSLEEAIKIFKLNQETFPESPNVYDALGDAYEKAGDKPNTLLNSKMAIEKLNKPTHLPPDFANRIRVSAEGKIKRIENPAPETVPLKRAHHAMVFDESSKNVFLTAGSTPVNGGQSYQFFNDIWKFDGTRWVKSGEAGEERSGIRLIYHPGQHKIFSFGGYHQDGRSSGELRVLEGTEWKVVVDHPEIKAAEPGFVYDLKRDRMVAFGGSAGRGLINSEVWEWDGKTWKKFSGLVPTARQAFVMEYDLKRARTVVYGGGGAGGFLDDTWEFDGKVWKKISDKGPGARTSPGYAYDSKRGLLIIFGGADKNGLLGDTWAWDGKVWKKLSETGPSPRAMGYMAYDKARDRIVLFGGRPGWPNDANDTWEWDGKEWKEIAY